MSRFNPNHTNAGDVFAAAAEFKQRCLLDQKSLFLPGTQLWTPEHFKSLIDHFVNQPDDGKRAFYKKLEDQLAACDSLDVALMAEVYWIVQLGPTNLGVLKKNESVRRIWNIKPASDFPTQSSFMRGGALSGLGSAGPGYNNYVAKEMAFAVQAFADFSAKTKTARESLLANPFGFARWLDGIPSSKGRQFYYVLCHLLFPDEFERIFSLGNKLEAARAHGIYTRALGNDRPGLDEAFLELRKRLEAQHGEEIDYYNPPVNTLARDAEVDEASQTPKSISPSRATDKPSALATHQEAVENIIYFGPPGTGKTYAMESRMAKAYMGGNEFEFVAFHPSYSYEEFVGGLRPVPENGGTKLEFHKGPFIRLCERAHADPTLRFTLFIDEINRANAAKVFGELITLLEPSKRVPAGSKPEEKTKGLWISLPGAPDELFGVPDNLDVVATMNSADRSIATLDLALRRRFRFQEFPSLPDKVEPRTVGALDLAMLLQRLNDRIEFLIDRDHVIGHEYFRNIRSLDNLRDTFAQRVIPLLQEYFFEDLSKVQLVLTGRDRDSVFLRSRELSPAMLFVDSRGTIGTQVVRSFVMGDPATWQEANFRAIYDARDVAAMEPVAAEAG